MPTTDQQLDTHHSKNQDQDGHVQSGPVTPNKFKGDTKFPVFSYELAPGVSAAYACQQINANDKPLKFMATHEVVEHKLNLIRQRDSKLAEEKRKKDLQRRKQKAEDNDEEFDEEEEEENDRKKKALPKLIFCTN